MVSPIVGASCSMMRWREYPGVFTFAILLDATERPACMALSADIAEFRAPLSDDNGVDMVSPPPKNRVKPAAPSLAPDRYNCGSTPQSRAPLPEGFRKGPCCGELTLNRREVFPDRPQWLWRIQDHREAGPVSGLILHSPRSPVRSMLGFSRLQGAATH